MARRKNRRSPANRRPANTPQVRPSVETPAAEAAAKQDATRATRVESAARDSAATSVDFASEYRYVVGDLKRIGALAAAMFALLVVLAQLL